MTGKQLRISILQEAVAGRLVSQNPSDEPASKLLKRIAPQATPLRGDIPYDIPSNWGWCRLKDICVFLSRGKSPKYSEEKKYPVFSQKCSLKDGWISLDNARFLDPATIGQWHDKYKLRTGDVLVNSTGTGTVCRARLFDEKCLGPYPFIVPDSHVSVVRTHRDVSSPFILYYVSSQCAQQYLEDNLTGSTNQKELYIGVLESLPVPLPPLAEQKRIVAKIEELMPLVDEYEEAQEEFDNLNAGLKGKLRASFLQEAIAGRLVPQDPNDEPASKLLKKIKEEKERLVKEGKLAKDKNETVIFRGDDRKFYEQKGKTVTCIDDQIPFEIPANWEWCRLGNIFSHRSGKALNQSDKKGTLRPYITTSNLYWDYFVLDDLRRMPFTEEELDKCTAVKGDLLVCEGGDVGRAAIWSYDEPICLQNHIHKLRAYVPLCVPFFHNALRLYKHTGLIGGKGIGLKGLSSRTLHNIILPLPPLAEQKRIVAKIEELFALLETLDETVARPHMS